MITCFKLVTAKTDGMPKMVCHNRNAIW